MACKNGWNCMFWRLGGYFGLKIGWEVVLVMNLGRWMFWVSLSLLPVMDVWIVAFCD